MKCVLITQKRLGLKYETYLAVQKKTVELKYVSIQDTRQRTQSVFRAAVRDVLCQVPVDGAFW